MLTLGQAMKGVPGQIKAEVLTFAVPPCLYAELSPTSLRVGVAYVQFLAAQPDRVIFWGPGTPIQAMQLHCGGLLGERGVPPQET